MNVTDPVINPTAVLLAHCDREQRYRFVNAAYAERFGLAPHELVGRRIDEVIGRRAYASLRPQLEAALAGKRMAFEQEVPYERLGTRRMRCLYEPELDARGGVRGLLATLTETGRGADDELARLVLQTSEDCIKVLDLQGRLLSMSAGGQRRLEICDVATVLGQSWIDFWQGADHAAARDAVAQAAAGCAARFEGYCATQSGKPKWWDVIVNPIPGADGRPQRLLAVSRDITERRRMEDELRQREQHLAAVVGTTPECVKVVAADGTLLDMNPAGLTMVEAASLEAVWGRSIYDVIAPEHREAFRAFNERVCRGEKATLEFDIVALRGTRRSMETHAVPLSRADGTLAQLAITREVTERRRAERILRESEQRLRDFADTAPANLWITEPDGSCTFLSRGWYEYTGQTESEALGFGWTQAVHPADRSRAGQIFLEANRRREPFALQYRVRRANGGYSWAIDAGRPRFAPDGTFLGFIGSVIDIDEVKRAEEARRESEQRLNAVLANTTSAIFFMDERQQCVYMNKAAEQLTGYTLAETQGRALHDVVHHTRPDGTHYPLAECPIDRAFPENNQEQGEEIFVHKDGSFYPVAFTASPMRDENAKAVGTIIEVREISAEKRAREALREADRRKDEFIATLSHELRNPLAPLRNALHLLRVDQGAAANVREMMERQVEHLVRLVDDLLELSRISRGTFELRKEHVELAAIVRNALETSEPLIKGARHALDVSLPGETLWVQGDPVRLAQILANLLNNAAKYTDAGGRIALEAQRCENHAEIAVRDNGQGIAPEALPTLFEMFHRGARTAGRAQAGLGVGLALARQLAEMHGGTLTAASEGPRRGSVFTLRLPLAEAPHREHRAGELARSGLQGRRILVVDDNADAAESLAMVLRLLGAEVRIAREGREALELFASAEPEAVLLDIGMPGMDGYEVARRIRRDFPQRRALLVALTGWGQEQDRRRAQEAGFDHHLVKPAEIGALQALLAEPDRTARTPAQ